MILTNQNREDLKFKMTTSEYKNLISKTLPELNTDILNPDIPSLAKIIAIHLFMNENLFYSNNSFEITQIKIITKNILKSLNEDGVSGLLENKNETKWEFCHETEKTFNQWEKWKQDLYKDF